MEYLPNAETDRVGRALLEWLNEYPDKPVPIRYERLEPKGESMAVGAVQRAYKTRRFITGGYQAQYPFVLGYRIQPESGDESLRADELLNAMADWAAAREDKPLLGAGRKALQIECDGRAIAAAAYDDGSEDHQIPLTLTYEVRGGPGN